MPVAKITYLTPAAKPKKTAVAVSRKKAMKSADEGVKYLWGFSGILGDLWEFQFNVRCFVCYDMSELELSDTTVSDVGADDDSGSDDAHDDAVENEAPVEIVDGLSTFFINDPSGNLN